MGEEAAFSKWLHCYYQDGMKNLVDSNGRTMWFSGQPGSMIPKQSKTRGRVSVKKNFKESDEEVKANIKKEKPSIKSKDSKQTKKSENSKKLKIKYEKPLLEEKVKRVQEKGKRFKSKTIIKEENDNDTLFGGNGNKKNRNPEKIKKARGRCMECVSCLSM